MARPIRLPAYRLHKARNCAVVTIAGRDYYLGAYGSIESHQKYGDLIAKYSAGLLIPTQNKTTPGIMLCELTLSYVQFAEKYYQKNGRPTDEYHCILSALRPLCFLYGDYFVADFGPLALKAVRTRMIELKWSRKYINKSIGRIRRMFRWGVSNELFGVEVLTRLQAVESLFEGRSDAIERPTRTEVPEENIAAVRNSVNERIRDMMDLALWTGARPGELVMLTGHMIDQSDDVWTATLSTHKMQHKGKARILAFGPNSQQVLRKYLQGDLKARLFPMTRATFSANIKAACLKLGIPAFTGHWLRHNAATRIREAKGLDSAQVLLGHSKASTTEIYAHVDNSKLIEIARVHG